MRAHHVVSIVWVLAVGGCAVRPPAGAPTPRVRPGIEVLLSDSAHLIAGRRLGLLTNHTGIDRQGRRDADLLRTAHGGRLTVLFSPEHGFRGTEDRPGLPDGVDSATGLPIYSLYGGSRSGARAALDSVDVLLVDLQDIGARYYTYIATATSLMRDAARAGTRVIVLDRPNPVGGSAVQGNVRPDAGDPDSVFVGFLPVAMRHGMTLGELALMANDVLALGADLIVVPAAGWNRDWLYDQTGLPWVRPSPNMPDLESALHYPGLCLFEGTNLSVGRGTPVAFQLLGAPWMDAEAVVRRVRGAAMAGVEVEPVAFTPRQPTDGKYDGEALRGLRLRVTDRRAYDPTRLAVALLAAIRATHPREFEFRPATFDRLAAGPELRQAVAAGRPAREIWDGWQQDLARFRVGRAKYLLY
ncbi:MAG: exo-beta-N-acetylmuramidase NamZ family protein [Gemmatimonadales bacterium]